MLIPQLATAAALMLAGQTAAKSSGPVQNPSCKDKDSPSIKCVTANAHHEWLTTDLAAGLGRAEQVQYSNECAQQKWKATNGYHQTVSLTGIIRNDHWSICSAEFGSGWTCSCTG